jgi:hypothetical protein
MRIASLAAAATLALTMVAAATPSSAAPYGRHTTHVAPEVRVDVRHGGRHFGHHHWNHGRRHVWNQCRAWRHECADRWGWGTWRFQRCMARHGC